MTDDWRDLDRRLAARLPDPGSVDLDTAWRTFRRRAASGAGVGTVATRRRLGIPLGVAAVAAVVLLFVRLAAPTEPMAEILTAPGERRTFQLPDGSSVVLAPASRLRYPRAVEAPRTAELDGQAWFEVISSPDRPFRIATGGHEVIVLGTAFGVEARDAGDSVTVTVASGRVAFRRAGGPALELRAGQGAAAGRGADPRALDSMTAARQPAWVGGSLRFDGTPLESVARDLERWFAVEIHMDPGLRTRRLSGVIDLDAPERAFETLAAALDLRIERAGSRVSLHARGKPAR